MLSRKMTNQTPSIIPQSWLDEVNSVLNETYQQQCLSLSTEIETFGEIYTDELAVAFSLVYKHNKLGKAITLFTSTDINSESNPKEILDHILDSSSEFFDLILNDDLNNNNEEIYQSLWSQTKFEKDNFFYKISRENLITTMKANEFLKKY